MNFIKRIIESRLPRPITVPEQTQMLDSNDGLELGAPNPVETLAIERSFVPIPSVASVQSESSKLDDPMLQPSKPVECFEESQMFDFHTTRDKIAVETASIQAQSQLIEENRFPLKFRADTPSPLSVQSHLTSPNLLQLATLPKADAQEIGSYLDRINSSAEQWRTGRKELDEAATRSAIIAPQNTAPQRAESPETAPQITAHMLPDSKSDETPIQTATTAAHASPAQNSEPQDAPPIGRSNRHPKRVKTRLIGFESAGGDNDLFASANQSVPERRQTRFPVGWIVITDGPGLGHSFDLQNGVSQVGRGEGQAIRLNFGDTSISRINHAAIAYDQRLNKFYLGHGGKANLVRLNANPLLSTEEISDGDSIEIGETILRFIALCSAVFKWDDMGQDL